MKAQYGENTVQYKTANINGLDIFYREAGNRKNPTILLLHGFPSSSHMYRNLIKELADEYHTIAPDYPGFGNNDQPPMNDFEYTFDNLSNVINNFVEKIFIIYCYLIGRVDTYNSGTRRRLGASDSIANTPLRSLTISIEAIPALSLGNGIQSA